MDKKTILFVNLKREEFSLKYFSSYWEYLGGVGLALKLFRDNQQLDPLILTVGPLNGLFPYVSKTCVLQHSGEKNRVEDFYAGGSLSFLMRQMGLDGIILYGKSSEPVVLDITYGKVGFVRVVGGAEVTAGKLGYGAKSTLFFNKKGVAVDGYFSFGSFAESGLGNLLGLVLSGSGEIRVKDPTGYIDLVSKLTKDRTRLGVAFGGNPSCFGCPAGCEFSKDGEEGNSAVLPKCLVSCQYAENIYRDPTLVFSCLSVLGVPYHHEHLENIAQIVGELKREIEKK